MTGSHDVDEQLFHRYRQWQDADGTGRDDEADAACEAVFRTVRQEPRVPAAFTARTVAAVAAATARDARQEQRTRRTILGVSVAAGAAGLYAGGGWALSAASTLLVTMLEVIVGTVVRTAVALQSGTDVWTVLANLGRAVAAFVADPSITVAIFAMQGLAMAALVALRRLLDPDRGSFK
jgi:hypothetical protein